MSAASPAHNQVRRNAPAAPYPSPQPQAQPHAPVRQRARADDFGAPRGEEEIRLNLRDIPALPGNLDVEEFKPSVLSRLFDLVAPLDRR